MIPIRLLEKGTHYESNAADYLYKQFDGALREDDCKSIINQQLKDKIPAFHHEPRMRKYIMGLARMVWEECKDDPTKLYGFLQDCIYPMNDYLIWVRDNLDKIPNLEAFNKEFKETLSYKDLCARVKQMEVAREERSKDELSKMSFGTSNYKLVPIESFDQMCELYGGHWTGNGRDFDGKYAGNGGTAWCHTNSESVYNGSEWTNNGKRKFFVLQANNWKDIPFNPKTNQAEEGKDAYGNSLIAILTDKYGKLLKATLRCNHEGVETFPDNQYDTYADLSKLAGFNVEEEVEKYCETKDPNAIDYIVTDGVFEGFDPDVKSDIEVFSIPEGVTSIAENAFQGCDSLRSVFIPDSVFIIGDGAFYGCRSLRSVYLPDYLEYLGVSAFANCKSLSDIILPSGFIKIPMYCFSYTNLSSVSIPEGINIIGENAFMGCARLSSVNLPYSVRTIDAEAFQDCYNLRSLSWDADCNVKYIGDRAFEGCQSLENTGLSYARQLHSIGDSAFKKCWRLEDPELADNVKIGSDAFADTDFEEKYKARYESVKPNGLKIHLQE